MKSCIEWRKGFKYLPQIDEFNIDFKNKEIKLLQFLNTYAHSQRVNIRLPKDYTKDNIDLLVAIYEKGYNIAIILPDNYYVNQLHDKHIPFYFEDLIFTWDQLIATIDSGVTDVFISGELGFDLERIKKIFPNVSLRCYANISQAGSSWFYGDGFKDFYIRPEDVDFYSNYIDVIEFYNSVEQQNILYEIYFKDKEWNGNLQEIIKGLRLKINNYYILGSEFARRRSQCQKGCMKGERCRLCDRLAELADSLEKSPDFDVFERR